MGSPLYDEEKFEVGITAQSESSYVAELRRPGGVISANAEVALPEALPQEIEDSPPARRGDPVAGPDHVGPAASFASLTNLQRHGCQAFRYGWGGEHDMQTYLRDASQMPELLQRNGGAYANMSFILGCSNWILASNAYMNPWIHLETRSQNFRPIPTGTAIVAEMKVADFYEKKGHEFVDVEVALFDEQNDACLSAIKLRAIYKLRGAQEPRGE
ncbi:MAG: hypothetical protein O7F73_19020 [Gammaproteobacteria bacterium]|nr:hypothetical protein [Gammaproteobacteria bacterium]